MKHFLFLILVICSGVSAFELNRVDEERLCLIQNVYFEAAGEGNLGHRAVTWVTLNRTRSGLWPSTVCKTVYQKSFSEVYEHCQFSWTCDGRNHKFNKKDQLLIEDIKNTVNKIYFKIDNDDVTNGATIYVRCDIINKIAYLKGRKQTVRINEHCFFKH